jgi:NAD(P)-dependent dehydrogenase (short-subunit alcohol dehydrogenase family)
LFDFTDKVVLVTGGSRGLGRAMCLGFADQGAKVVVASRKLENCEALAQDIRDGGGDALAVGAHTGSTEDLDALIETVMSHYGRVDILINNAGINPGMGPLSDLDPAVFDKMYAVNVKGPWYLASRLAPKMAATGGGAIINVISVGGLRPAAYMGVYASTKAALEALTKTMAQEWAPMNIRVNALAPGSYHSDLTDKSLEMLPEMEQGMIDAALIKRIADSEEILNPVVYLAAESYTTGITLVADGGLMVKV